MSLKHLVRLIAVSYLFLIGVLWAISAVGGVLSGRLGSLGGSVLPGLPISVEGLILTFTILAVAVLWGAAPLLRARAGGDKLNSAAQKQHDRLSAHYERALTNIRDLDEDFATGKIQQEDYEPEREKWVQRGIQILMALDEQDLLGAKAASAPSVRADASSDVDEAIDNEIEAAIAAYRNKAQPSAG